MNNQFTSDEHSQFGKFNVLTKTRDSHSSQYLSAQSKYIAIIPFERNSENNIKSIYLLDFPNYSTGRSAQSLIIDEIDQTKDKTVFDSVCRALVEEAGLDIDALSINENNIFYLGEITTTWPVSSTLQCYGIDLTGKASLEFTRNLSKDPFIKDESSIIQANFHQVVNGDYSDSTVLAGSFLLVSYFN